MSLSVQNVSFTGNGQKVAKLVKQEAVKVVSASTNLNGTQNSKEASLLNKAKKIFIDNNTMNERIDSFEAARQPISADNFGSKGQNVFVDINTMPERIHSYEAAKQPIIMPEKTKPEIEVVKEEPIIPERSINFFG